MKTIATFIIVCTIATISCGSGAMKAVIGTNGKPIPVEGTEIEAKIIEIYPANTEMYAPESPCYKNACKAKIKITKILNYGSQISAHLPDNKEVDVNFVYTLSPTENLFPNSPTHLSGLNLNDNFRAILRIIGQTESQENIYEIDFYKKLQ